MMIINISGLLLVSSFFPLLTLAEAKYCKDQKDYVADNCKCWIYKRSNCKTYYYSDGEGTTYILRNFHWDDVCAACCCETPGTDDTTPARTPIPSSYPSNGSTKETCCDNGNTAVKPKPKLKLKRNPEPKSKKSSKSITLLFNNSIVQESNFTLRPTGTPKPKLASHLPNYDERSRSWVNKNHYSLGTECWWKWKTPAILVTAFAALLGLVAAARGMGMGRMQSFRNARIAQSDLQVYGSTAVQNRGDFFNQYEKSDPQSFSVTAIVHPNYVPL